MVILFLICCENFVSNLLVCDLCLDVEDMVCIVGFECNGCEVSL